MPGTLDYFLGLLTILLEVGVVVCAIARGAFRRYFTINLYMGLSAVVTASRYWILFRYGLSSSHNFYFYYYSDAVLTVCLYFALMGLYATIFEDMKAESYLRFGTFLLLAGTACYSFAIVNKFSYNVVQQSAPKILTHFVLEMSQNLYFVGLVLTYVLWGAIMKMGESRSRVVQLVLSLGVYFSAFAANYALFNLYPNLQYIWAYMPPALACLLPLAWMYAFWRLPEEARLAPARLAVVPR